MRQTEGARLPHHNPAVRFGTLAFLWRLCGVWNFQVHLDKAAGIGGLLRIAVTADAGRA